ncbi:MAG: ABC transporter permease subunit [Chloroflexota bacterium]
MSSDIQPVPPTDPAQNDPQGEQLKKETRNALLRLLIALAIVIGFVIYSYGWTVTDIDLTKPQEGQRQENLQRSLRELFAPRLFQQDREQRDLAADFLMDCETGEAPAQQEPREGEPSIVIEPTCASSGDEVYIEVRNFVPLAETRIRWIPPGDAQSRSREILELEREDFVLDRNGDFSGTIIVPRISGTSGQINQIAARALIAVGPVRFSDTTDDVIAAMVETIFMALVATTIAIPIAAMLSFLAARNLMRPIRLPLGSMLVAVIALPVGWLLGVEVLARLGEAVISIGSDVAATFIDAVDPDEAVTLDGGDGLNIVLTYLLPFIALIATVVALRLARALAEQFQISETGYGEIIRGVLNQIVILLGLIMFIASLGGMGLLGGEQIKHIGESMAVTVADDAIYTFDIWLRNLLPDGIRAIGILIDTLGSLIELLFPLIAGLMTAFVLAGIFTSLTRSPLRRMRGVPNIVLGGVLGALGGWMLLALMGYIGRSAALLGLLGPIVGAILGGQLLVLIYMRTVAPAPNAGGVRTVRDNIIRTVLFWVGAAVTFVLAFDWLNVGRALIDGTLPPVADVDVLGLFTVPRYVWNNGLIGLLLGGLNGLLAGVNGSFPLGSSLYNISRTTLNSVRSVEPLIMGLIFVIWVGIGPFAGVLALTLHSIAALGKLYSEQVENIDPGPVEALQSTGANRLQTIVYAVVPQIVPPYIAFTMYRWDINVRMSTIIGFVGGGGIGLLLQQQINLLQYRDAGVAVLAIAIVVSILDYTSAYIRERLT